MGEGRSRGGGSIERNLRDSQLPKRPLRYRCCSKQRRKIKHSRSLVTKRKRGQTLAFRAQITAWLGVYDKNARRTTPGRFRQPGRWGVVDAVLTISQKKKSI